MAHATVTDLQKGWRLLTPTEQGIASELLQRASDMVDQALTQAGIDPSQLTSLQESVCKTVVCDMVQLSFGAGHLGNADIFGDSVDSMVLPSDNAGHGLWLTDNHLRLLGIRKSTAGFVGAQNTTVFPLSPRDCPYGLA